MKTVLVLTAGAVLGGVALAAIAVAQLARSPRSQEQLETLLIEAREWSQNLADQTSKAAKKATG